MTDGVAPPLRPKCWSLLSSFYKILNTASTSTKAFNGINVSGWAWTNAIPYAANWKRRFLQLSGDALRFHHQEDTESETRRVKEVKIAFFSAYEMDQWLLPARGPSKICVSLYSSTARVCDIVCDTDTEIGDWTQQLEKLFAKKFSSDDCAEIGSLWKRLQPYRDKEYEAMISVLKEQTIEEVMGTVGVSKTKVKQATLDIDIGNSRWSQVYLILAKSDIRFHKSKHKERGQRTYYHLFYQNLVHVIEDDDSRILHCYTALVHFQLLFPHDVVASEWHQALFRHARNLSPLHPTLTQIAKPLSQASPTLGYHVYQGKDLYKNIWIAMAFPNASKVKKKKKIKCSPFLIGRSRSADYQVSRTSGASRSHCQLVIENFVPYLVDLGQSKHGTYVNGEQITCQPLAPGDIIQLCDCQLMFGITKHLTYSYVPMMAESNSSSPRANFVPNNNNGTYISGVTNNNHYLNLSASGSTLSNSTPTLISPSLMDSSFLLHAPVRASSDGVKKMKKTVQLQM